MSKERPILFSGPMVRAILDGRKTQTRRVSGLDVLNANPSLWRPRGALGRFEHLECGAVEVAKCRCSVPGDRLWVKETFRVHGDFGNEKASTSTCTGPKDCEFRADFSGEELDAREWRPSLHMPRWASRITLEVVGVRVERLQDISEEDAIAEGCSAHETDKGGGYSAQVFFAHLWEGINGHGSWDANPWVWVVEFKVVQP